MIVLIIDTNNLFKKSIILQNYVYFIIVLGINNQCIFANGFYLLNNFT